MQKRSNRWISRACVLAGVTFMSGACLAADGPKYTYLEAGYLRTDIDGLSEDADSWALGGSLALTDMVHVFANYQDGEVDTRGPSIDVTGSELGLGLNYALSDTLDLVGSASWVHAEVDAGRCCSVDDDGLGLNLGLRAMVTPQLELNGGIGYVDIGSDDTTSVDIGAVYSFTEMVALTGGASLSDDVSTYGIGLRLYLDR